MANTLYPRFKQACLGGSVNLGTASVKAVLVDLADYTYSAAHEFLSDVPAGARVATSDALANTSIADGVFDSDDPGFASATGDVSEALILYIDTGDPATSRLVQYVDTATGLPVTPNGGDLAITVDATGWFAL